MAASASANLKIETAVEDTNIECEPDGNSFWDFANGARHGRSAIRVHLRAASLGDLRDPTGYPAAFTARRLDDNQLEMIPPVSEPRTGAAVAVLAVPDRWRSPFPAPA